MNTTDRIAAIREHLTALTNTDNDAPRLVAEVVQDFPAVVSIISDLMGCEIESLEHQLSVAEKRRVLVEKRISRARALLDMCVEEEISDDED